MEDLRNDGNASMPKRVKRPNPWEKKMMMKLCDLAFVEICYTVIYFYARGIYRKCKRNIGLQFRFTERFFEDLSGLWFPV